MGHIVGKDIYRNLGKKIDEMPFRTPWNESFHKILKELYSEEEADFVIKMPHGLSTFKQVREQSGLTAPNAEKILKTLCAKGLVMDFWLKGDYYYLPSPLVVGIFEFTMMRTGPDCDFKKWAELFHAYMNDDDAFVKANCDDNQRVSIMRTLPHVDTVRASDHLQILDYEKAAELVDQADRFSVGICPCRHEKMHLDLKKCNVPLETCTSLGFAADYLIRNNLAREISKAEMHENLARSKEMALVLNADNVKQRITYLCHCCKCCCNSLAGLSKFGYDNAIISSNFIAEVSPENCTGCGKCAKACPINAITMKRLDMPQGKKKQAPEVDRSFCLGCGVCGLKCESRGIGLVKRGERVITPETTFEKTVLVAFERGNLQNLIFENQNSISQKFLRGLMSTFFKLPPVKKALMSDALRSTFLQSMKAGAKIQGKGWLLDL